MNNTAQQIYDFLHNGDNEIYGTTISKELKISLRTVQKYLKLLQDINKISMIVIPRKGGAKNDSRLTTIITKH